ncbi:winged helix DNA-binding protein [Sphingomonas sp. Leaf38]|jgi:DNA-binding MarR family transcriptional regulator|uniref:winged helix DNA-binding protein n=1 Tax=Sphingomonas sp. Leaf38 TaxID=1736217 RepID=UPI0009E7C077|nr:winged helix DNA-binding protein [Sphingomonas sp. Leaf38]
MTYVLALAPLLTPLATPIAAPARKTKDCAFAPVLPQAQLAQIAKRLYEVRQMRADILGDALFSEPAWDILLDLFISEHEERQLSVSAVCIGARSPSATALRYLSMLQDAGLVDRTRDERDGRRSHVRLTTQGRRRMAMLLGRLVTP